MINKKDYYYASILTIDREFKHMNEDKKILLNELTKIEQEHRDLDDIINHLQEQKTINLLQMQRLKKRKLLLKDKIAVLKDKIDPDIIA